MTSDCPGIVELTGKFTPLKPNTVLLQTHVLILPISLHTHTQLLINIGSTERGVFLLHKNVRPDKVKENIRPKKRYWHRKL